MSAKKQDTRAVSLVFVSISSSEFRDKYDPVALQTALWFEHPLPGAILLLLTVFLECS
jgi:hypothetical protein